MANERSTNQGRIGPLIDFFNYRNNVTPEEKLLKVFVTIPEETLDTNEGYSNEFRKWWLKLENAGIQYTARSKPLETKNLTHEPNSSAKPVTMKPKTAGIKSACKGHLPIKENKADVFDYSENREVAKTKYKGDEIYVTYERQSLNYIQAQIESENYKLESIEKKSYTDINNIVHNDVYHIEILDKDGEKFLIRLDQFLEPTWKRSSVVEMSSRYLNKPTSTKSQSRVKTLKEQFNELAQSETYRANYDHTVKLLHYEGEVLIEAPHIVSDKFGRPTRGDVDTQNTFLPDYLPAKAFKILDYGVDADSLIRSLRILRMDLEKQLDKRMPQKLRSGQEDVNSENFDIERLAEEFQKSDAKSLNLVGLLSSSIKILEEMRVKDPKSANIMVAELGSINLFNAAVLLALRTDILHGPEAVSPIYPENITVTNIQKPAEVTATHVYQTHSEYEYLRLIHTDDKILEKKVMDFNPCWFVPAPEYKNAKGELVKWRVDNGETRDVNRKKHLCNNLANEDVSIELWKLMFEKQLLQYKLSSSHNEKQFNNYIEVLLYNFDSMINNPISKNVDKLPDTLAAGKKVAEIIIQHVAENYDSDEKIGMRIKEIKQIATGSDADVNQRIQDRIAARLSGKIHP